MPYFPSLPDNSSVRSIWERFNKKGSEALSAFSRKFMHTESMLSPGEKEMIAAYVSQLNRADYCYSGHSKVAINWGVESDIFDLLIENIDKAPLRKELIPLMQFIKKLTLEPSQISQIDSNAVFEAGWDEQSFHEAICVCARFSMMNRIT